MARKQELRKARKDENKESIELMHCRQRFVLLKRKDKLARKQASHLERYDYKDPARAEEYLRCWIKDALSSSPSMLRKTAEGFLEKNSILSTGSKRKSARLCQKASTIKSNVSNVWSMGIKT